MKIYTNPYLKEEDKGNNVFIIISALFILVAGLSVYYLYFNKSAKNKLQEPEPYTRVASGLAVTIPNLSSSSDLDVSKIPLNLKKLTSQFSGTYVSIKRDLYSDSSRGYNVIYEAKGRIKDVFLSIYGLSHVKPFQFYTASMTDKDGVIELGDEDYHYKVFFSAISSTSPFTKVNLTAIKYSSD